MLAQLPLEKLDLSLSKVTCNLPEGALGEANDGMHFANGKCWWL